MRLMPKHVPERWQTIEAALAMSAGLDGIEKHYPEKTLNAAASEYPCGIAIREVLLIAAREAGGFNIGRNDIHAIFHAAFANPLVASTGYSNSSVPGILSNLANKYMEAGFNAVESGWRDIAAIRPVTDFKQISSYSLTGDMQYELVGPTGELKSATLGELKYNNQAQTYGKLFSVTRQDIINDDLGAFTQVPRKLGRGAALKLNSVFWTAFMAGVGSFWAAGNANLITGAGTVLGAAGLTTALTSFRKQTDPDGMPLGITPRVLLVPPELEVTARQLMNAQFFNTGGAATTAQVPNMNTWQGSYKIAQASYLSNAAITGNSATAWYLLADPEDMPTIEVCFLNGRDVPLVESAEAETSTLGIQYRGVHDFGVSLQEFRGSVRSAGA